MFVTSFYFALKITDALNENEFQFKFGVFTRWDQDIPETDKPKRQRASEKHKEEFENSVKGEKGVYFVEAKNATVPMVSFLFVYSSNLIGATCNRRTRQIEILEVADGYNL